MRDDGTFDVSVPISQEEINQSYLNQLEKLENQLRLQKSYRYKQ